MKIKILSVALALAGAMTIASCLSDNDSSSDIVYYGDGAITSFSLGKLNRYYLYNNGDTIKKTTDGTDSVTTVACSGYKMTIDQLAYATDENGNPTKMHPIWNTDSLPAGTDIRKTVTTISSKNSGIITLLRLKKKPTDKDTLDYYNSADSIDFSTPREFRIFSTDGTYYRRYQVKINVHKQLPDSFVWHRQQMFDPAQQTTFTAARTYAMGDNVYSAASDGTTLTTIWKKNINDDNAQWVVAVSNMNKVFSPESYKNIAVLGGWMYLLHQGTLFKAQDAQNWQQVATGLDNIKQLAGASCRKLYALTDNGIASSADGKTWTEEAFEDAKENLPATDISLCALPLKSNKDVERVIIMGSGSTGKTAVWGKIEDSSETTDSYKWNSYDGESQYALPDMKGLSVMYFDGKLYAIGGEGQNGSTASPYAKLYCSGDQGLTWKKSTLFTLPADMPKDIDPATLTMLADKENHVWIVSAKTGTAWKMRINRLGWKQEQKAFNE